jgi:hypothetical protein
MSEKYLKGHQTQNNYQTSDLQEKYPSKKASGGIHRIGSKAVPSFL